MPDTLATTPKLLSIGDHRTDSECAVVPHPTPCRLRRWPSPDGTQVRSVRHWAARRQVRKPVKSLAVLVVDEALQLLVEHGGGHIALLAEIFFQREVDRIGAPWLQVRLAAAAADQVPR